MALRGRGQYGNLLHYYYTISRTRVCMSLGRILWHHTCPDDVPLALGAVACPSLSRDVQDVDLAA